MSRCPADAGSMLGDARIDYADCFMVSLDRPGTATAELWGRTALEQAPAVIRWIIRAVHTHVLRFTLGPPNEPGHILGWSIVSSTPDALHIETSGPLLRAAIIAHRPTPTRLTFTTALHYNARASGAIWAGVAPLHRTLARTLLRRAAASLTQTDGPTPKTPPAI